MTQPVSWQGLSPKPKEKAAGLLICAATSWEALPIVKIFGLSPSGHFFSGNFRGVSVILLKTGMGEAALESALRILPHAAVFDRAISTGFCGALKPELRCGDIVCDFGEKGGVFEKLASDQAAAQQTRVYFGALAYSPAVLSSPRLKKDLGEISGAFAVDMETLPLKNWIQKNRPYCEVWSVRVVLDEIKDSLPDDFPKGENRGALIFYALTHIGDWPLLLRTYWKQRKASKNLNSFLAGLIE